MIEYCADLMGMSGDRLGFHHPGSYSPKIGDRPNSLTVSYDVNCSFTTYFVQIYFH